MQPGTRTESEVVVQQSVIECDPPTSAPAAEKPISWTEPVVAESSSGSGGANPGDENLDGGGTGCGADDYLLGTPAAGCAVTGGLVVGVAAAVGIVMVSVVAMLITALVGTLIAYVVAHDDEWVRALRRRRARRQQVLVAPGWARHTWDAGHGVSRHVAT